MLKTAASLIMTHTAPSRAHLTPELVLRLVTSSCPLWRATEDQLPFPDPFWAFYWPGGQAMARYILDNGELVRNRRVLDVGCGCGAGAIAARRMGARAALANDIDSYATTASMLNAALNNVTLETCTEDLINTKCEEFDTVLVGDMFYDEEFAKVLFDWLLKLRSNGKTILIGDPGRHGLTNTRRQHIQLLQTYALPKDSCIENRGFTETSVWGLI